MFEKKQLVKIQNVAFANEMSFYYLGSLEEVERLSDKRHPLFEAGDEYFIVDGFSVFRYLKPETEPKILKVEKLELNPDHYGVRVELTMQRLFAFAREQQITVMETSDGYYLPGPTLMFCRKGKELKHG